MYWSEVIAHLRQKARPRPVGQPSLVCGSIQGKSDDIRPFDVSRLCKRMIAPCDNDDRFRKQGHLVNTSQFLRLPNPRNQQIQRASFKLRQ